jgi:hypothetical protein
MNANRGIRRSKLPAPSPSGRAGLLLIVIAGFAEAGCNGRLGQFTSLAMGGDGLGLVSYQDAPNGLLKVAHCEDPSCTRASLSAIDGPAPGEDITVGWQSSIAIGIDGLGLISYDGRRGLWVAHCEDAACSRAQTSQVDTDLFGLEANDIAIGRDGLGLIVYGDSYALRMAHCEDVACTRATLSRLASGPGSSSDDTSFAALAIGSDGLGMIAYHAEDALKVAHCEDTACTSATFSIIDTAPAVGQYPSIAIGVDGLPLISYWDLPARGLRVAHCADIRCTSADSISTVDLGGPNGTVGTYTSLAIGPDGQALVSYKGSTTSHYSAQDLRVAHCQGLACRTAVVSTVDHTPGFDLGEYSSIAFGPDGLALISYLGELGYQPESLRVAKCLDLACTRATISLIDVAIP